nr:uncharacterized protein LOC127298032 [Lolium perenne]
MARGNRRERRSNPALPPASSLGQQLDPAAALAAYEHVRRGTHAKALRILQKEIDKLGGLDSSPPFLIHAYSTAHKGAADVSADRKIRARHFRAAAEASRRATEAAPGSAVLAHSYAMVLLGACRDMDEDDALATYETIIAECERAIHIQEPSEPTLYHLLPADSDRHTTAGEALLADLRELQHLVSTDLHRMRRYNEIKLNVAEYLRQQQHTSAADAAADVPATSLAGPCADQSLEQSCEVTEDSGKCKAQCIVPQVSADMEKSQKIQTPLDSDEFGWNLSTSDAHPNKQEEETPADVTVEYHVRTNDEPNPKQFAEQPTSTSTPSEFGNGTIPSDNVQIQDDDDYDRCFLEDLCKSTALISIAEEVHGSCLKSSDDDKNCLLNVIIQSLWHLRGFRDELLKTSLRHKHVGDPRVVSCVVCSLCHIFIESGKASKGIGEAVAPTSLRMALSTSSLTETLFQMEQMNDASEVLEAILRCVHDSYTNVVDCHAKSHENNLGGSWDCAKSDCIAHNIFGADVYTRINCSNCRLGSRQLKRTLFLHHINTGSLQRAMRMCPDNTFDDLLKTVIMDGHITCDPDVGGCGKSNHINHTLSCSPHVFTVVLEWRTGNGSVSDTLLSDILAAIGTEIDISVIYPGTSPRSKHSLVSVACFYNQRYICFAVDSGQWVLYDDQTAKVVGDWIQVLMMCEEKEMQPLVLFFEGAN